MSVVEAHEVTGMITLDTPWDELVKRPELADIPQDELAQMKLQYEELQASDSPRHGGFPWFPFIFTNKFDS